MKTLLVILKRLIQGVPSVLIAMIGIFLLLQLAPGDAVDALMAESGGGDAAAAEAMRQALGLDQSLLVQGSIFLKRLATFDFGHSVVFGQPVSQVLMSRLAPTLWLMCLSMTFAFFIGSLLGLIASRNHNRGIDVGLSSGSVLAYALPTFWLALLLILLFSVHLRILPSAGWGTIGASLTAFERALDTGKYLILPVVTLSLTYVAIYFRLMRSSALEVRHLEFVRTARAKGLSDARVELSHIAPNAILPVITVLGLQIGAMLGGSVVVESVFSIPGLGRLAFESVAKRDFNVLLALVFLSSILVIIINALVDALYRLLDPRIG